jgi:hypothetical protein
MQWIYGSRVCNAWTIFSKIRCFSFGVLILEIVSGQKITCFHDGENIEYLLSYVSMTISIGTFPFFKKKMKLKSK